MLAAGLLAKNAVEKGLSARPWVKTTLAPGSMVVMDYYERAGLIPYLEKLGFNLVGFGCTTCIGNSGPLLEPISDAISEADLSVVVGAVRQPELRGPHQSRLPHELPRLSSTGRRLRAGRLHGRGPDQRAARHGHGRPARLPARHLAVACRGGRGGRVVDRVQDVHVVLRLRLRGRRALEEPGDPGPGRVRVVGDFDLRAQAPVLRGHGDDAAAPGGRARRPGPGQAGRQCHHRPHLAGGQHSPGRPGRTVAGGRRRARWRTSTPMARGAATTKS